MIRAYNRLIARACVVLASAMAFAACGKDQAPVAPVASAASAAERPTSAAAPFVEGVHYARVTSPVPVSPPAGQVDVVEVFSYGCHFCNDAEPHFRKWQVSEGAKRAVVSHLPATFNDLFALVGRGYYAAEALGVRGRTHQKIFDAFFVEHREVRSLDDLAGVYESLGVERAQFLAAAGSADVAAAYARGEQYQRDAGIDSVPTFVINGKYRVSPRAGGNHDELFRVVDHLIAQELAGR